MQVAPFCKSPRRPRVAAKEEKDMGPQLRLELVDHCVVENSE